ncbi:hypothetical protein [uncultured Amnibacterium sp.]
MNEESNVLAVPVGIVLVLGFWFACSIANHQAVDTDYSGTCTRALPQNC